MGFKLGSENRDFKSSKNVQIVRTPLEKGTVAEARMDGTIAINPNVKVNSPLYKRVIKHEQAHIDQIQEERAAYGENWVMWEGKIYIRKNGFIDGPNGRWPEGHPNHPWEAEAIKAENSNN
mgnify:CR=1 FL=1